ncbi:MAG TPA: DUF58 domain-containing protein [Gemmatales bacterium]|nr:DUF58 domain-containing protein [Gemmatales bacterium]
MIRWVLASMAILAVALVFGLGLLAYAMYALLGLIFVSRFLAVTWSQNIYAERKPNLKEIDIGEAVPIAVAIGNRGTIPIPWVLVEDFQPENYLQSRPPRLHIEGKRQRITLLWGNSQKILRYQITPRMRGFYQFGPLVLEGGDLFGLYRRFRVAAAPQFLLVYPKIVPLEGYDLASRRPIGEIRLTHRLFEDPTRIAGVRAYEAGDAMNRVHWRTTARLGSLHCKVYEPSTIAGATILLDFHVNSFHLRGEPYRSELAVTTAMSLANAVYQMGQQIGLISNGRDAAERIRLEGWSTEKDDGIADFLTRRLALAEAAQCESASRLQPVVVSTRRGPEQLQQLRETLARLELNQGLELPDLIDEAESYLPRDATIIAILSQITPASAIALSALRQRGFAVEIILIIMDREEHEAALQLLASENLNARHLSDEAAIAEICRQQTLR